MLFNGDWDEEPGDSFEIRSDYPKYSKKELNYSFDDRFSDLETYGRGEYPILFFL